MESDIPGPGKPLQCGTKSGGSVRKTKGTGKNPDYVTRRSLTRRKQNAVHTTDVDSGLFPPERFLMCRPPTVGVDNRCARQFDHVYSCEWRHRDSNKELSEISVDGSWICQSGSQRFSFSPDWHRLG